MKKSKWFTGMVLVSLAAIVQAHTHLKETVPAEGSTVNAAPEQIMFTFSEAARVTALTIQKEGEQEQKLAPLPTAAAAQVMVPAPKLTPGKYIVSWRVVSDDNHVTSGTLHFIVADSAPGGMPSHDHNQ